MTPETNHDHLRLAMERINHFLNEAEKEKLAQQIKADRPTLRRSGSFRRKVGFQLIRWGLKLASE